MIDPRGARIIARKAIQDGLLIKEPCIRCGAEKTEAHHEDYNQPLWVTWLCRACHGARHREINQEAGSNNDFRTTITLSIEMSAQIDNYWHAEQLRSRNEAIRELLRRALETKPVEYALRRARDQVSDAQPAKEQRR